MTLALNGWFTCAAYSLDVEGCEPISKIDYGEFCPRSKYRRHGIATGRRRRIRGHSHFFEGRLQTFRMQSVDSLEIYVKQGAHHLLIVLLGIRVLPRINPDVACVTDAISIAIKSLGLPPLALAMFTENHFTESI